MISGSQNGKDCPPVGAYDRTTTTRLETYFPRVFAYLRGRCGDEEAARRMASHAFDDLFARPHTAEADFEIALFRASRTLLGRFHARRKEAGGLTTREQEVISLVFDAQLDRRQIALVLDVTGDAVASSLLTGLRKMRTRPGAFPHGRPAPSFS